MMIIKNDTYQYDDYLMIPINIITIKMIII